MKLLLDVQCSLIILAGSVNVAATTECRRCIPIDDLIAHAHGISISLHGITSAVSFHNRTVRSVGSLAPPPALADLLERWRTESEGGGLSDHWAGGGFGPEPPEGSHLGMSRLQPVWARLFGAAKETTTATTPTTVGQDAQVLCDALLALRELNSVPPMQNVGISIPIWTTDTQALELFAAAKCAGLTIRDLVHDAAATAASQGIDLCRVPSEYLPCDPQHIMILDLSERVLIASFHAVYQGWYFWQPRRYDISDRLGQIIHQASAVANISGNIIKETTDWINGFIQDRPIHKLYLIGPLANNSVLREAIEGSQIGNQLQRLENFNSAEAIAAGAATLVKISMEDQPTDCIEPPHCENLRKKADKMAGNSIKEEHREL